MHGKSMRLKRFFYPSNKVCVVPMDHGMTLGPIDGLKNYTGMIEQVAEGGADAVILHKGLLMKVIEQTDSFNCKYIMHLSASTVLSADPSSKTLVGTVEEALRLGADGVSMHVNLGCEYESQMINDLGKVSADCQKWGMPLLAMMYVESGNECNCNKIIHAARVAEELGADIVKINCLGIAGRLDMLFDSVRIPVLIAGGPQTDEVQVLLKMIGDALEAGAAGVAIGRNIFQYSQPKFLTGIISRMVHGEILLTDAVYELKHNTGHKLVNYI